MGYGTTPLAMTRPPSITSIYNYPPLPTGCCHAGAAVDDEVTGKLPPQLVVPGQELRKPQHAQQRRRISAALLDDGHVCIGSDLRPNPRRMRLEHGIPVAVLPARDVCDAPIHAGIQVEARGDRRALSPDQEMCP